MRSPHVCRSPWGTLPSHLSSAASQGQDSTWCGTCTTNQPHVLQTCVRAICESGVSTFLRYKRELSGTGWTREVGAKANENRQDGPARASSTRRPQQQCRGVRRTSTVLFQNRLD